MSDFSVLKKLAQDANEQFPALEDQWSMVCTPTVGLDLIAEIERLTQQNRLLTEHNEFLASSDSRLAPELRAVKDALGLDFTASVGGEVVPLIERLRKLPTCWTEVLEQSEANDQLLDQVLELSAELDGYKQGAQVEADAGDEARKEVSQLKTENDELRATVDLQKLLPEIRGVLKDLELHGFRCDQSFRKLKDWYRKVGLAYRVIQGPMFGAEHGELVSQNTWLRSVVEHYAQQHAPLEPIPDSDGWSTRLPGYDLPALLRDAERYRWLRDKSGNHRGSYSPIPIQQNPDGSLSMIDGQLMSVCDENLDDDIDAAMSKEGK